MSEALGEIRFRNPEIFTGDTGTVDKENCVIRGVSVITGGVEAEGHNLQVDNTTLKQLQTCAKAKNKVPVNLDHGAGVKDLNGYLTYFRMDSNKLRADWHLLKTHDETPKMLERAETMPECFGLSVAFKGPPKGVPVGGGKMAARCEKLLSVDCVTRPAANEGLFSVPEVDSGKKSMAEENKKAAGAVNEDPNAAKEPTLQQVVDMLKDIGGRLDKHDEIFKGINGDELPTLEDLDAMSEEELAELGVTRAEVDTAIAEALANEEADPNAADPNAEPVAPAAAARGAADVHAPGAVATAGAGAELAALQKDVNDLQKKQKLVELKAKKQAEDHEFTEIETKITTLAEQRDTAIKLAEKYQAENEALRLAVKTGTRPVKPGVDNGLRMFSAGDNGELHEFQVRVKQLKDGGKTEAEAVRFAQKENPALHADWLQSQNRKPVTVE